MAKYKVDCGALVTRLMKRTFVIHANSKEEAIAKAEERFDKAIDDLKTYTEKGASLMIDNVERID